MARLPLLQVVILRHGIVHQRFIAQIRSVVHGFRQRDVIEQIPYQGTVFKIHRPCPGKVRLFLLLQFGGREQEIRRGGLLLENPQRVDPVCQTPLTLATI